ncbi:nucleotide exchange factor GrpE [Candidatus Woesearchaeota archaeon]|nr:nucleotide exchange factor GrpE [Candidatus Woesearchaeota archaeon]
MEKKNQKKTLKEPTAELTELLQRTQANLENYRKQTEKRIVEIRQMAARDIILQILPVMDNFELALKNTCSNQDDFLSGAEKSKISGTPKNSFNEFLMGVELIYSQLLTVLKDNKIKTIETQNQLFDPFYHEAILKVDSELPENTIVEEVQKGFLLNDKVIRHTKVKISAGKKKEEQTNKNKNQDGGQ